MTETIKYRDAGTIRDLIDHMADTRPDVTFLINPETNDLITFGELRRNVRTLSSWLRGKGLRPGDKIAFLMDNGLFSAEVFLGAMYGGFVSVPLNVRAGVSQLAYTLGHSDARVVFVESLYDALLNEVLANIGGEVDTIHVDRNTGLALDATAQSVTDDPPIKSEDPALLMYTSGSTGQPKAAIHTHRSLLTHGRNSVAAHRLTSEDRSLLVLPLYHINAECVTLMPALTSGGSVVIPHQFAVSEFWNWIDDWRCTWSAIVPTIVSQLLDWQDPKVDQRAEAFSRIRFLRSSSAPLSPALHQEFLDKFKLPLIQAMGSSEAGNIFSNPVPPGANKLGSPGTPWGFEIRIVDSSGAEAARGDPGELLIRGDGMMRGYHKDAAETAAVLDADGWFHTGDLAYQDADGYIFVVGRSKELIIKGGVNISPKQIDEVIESFPAVLEAAVVGVPDRYLGEDLVAFAVLRSGATCKEREILSFCATHLGPFKTPTRICFVQELPKGPSGKVQRMRLRDDAVRLAASPSGAESGEPEAHPCSVASPKIEQVIAEIWSSHLSREVADPSSNFFALGGHSLMALECLADLREKLGVILSLRDFFEHATIALQAALIRDRACLNAAPRPTGALSAAGAPTANADEPIPPRDPAAPCPLSLSQHRIWFMDELNSGVPVYNESEAVRLRGSLDSDSLEAALNVVVDRHDVLRTTVERAADGPRAVVHERWPLRLRRLDLNVLSAAEREAEMQRLLIDEPRRPFHLADEPGIRATLLCMGATDHVLIVMMHHMICDRASMGVMWGELSAAYSALLSGAAPELPVLPIQHSDYAAWQRFRPDERRLEEDLVYWDRQLRGVPALLELPADGSRPPVCSYRGARRRFHLPVELARSLRQFSGQEHITLFVLFAAALNVLLFRYSGQEDIVVGIPLADRDRPELQSMIGFLLHTHALRIRLSGDISFRALLAEVRRGVLDLYDHRYPQFDQVVSRVKPHRSLGYSPIFQVMLNWRESHQELGSIGLEGLQVESLLSETRTSKFDMTAILTDATDEIWLEMEWNTDLFDEARIERMVGHLLTLLEGGATNPERRVSEMSMLTRAERQQLLVEFNDLEADEIYP